MNRRYALDHLLGQIDNHLLGDLLIDLDPMLLGIPNRKHHQLVFSVFVKEEG
jgi:hypothetical protein